MAKPLNMEQEPHQQPKEELELFKEEVDSAIENMFVFLEAEDDPDKRPIPLDPYMSDDEKPSFESLPPSHQQAAIDVLFKKLGVNPNELESSRVREDYEMVVSGGTYEGRIVISVFSTQKEGVFLHRLRYEDNKDRWAIGPNVNM